MPEILFNKVLVSYMPLFLAELFSDLDNDLSLFSTETIFIFWVELFMDSL